MSPEDRELLNDLCIHIQEEKDPRKFERYLRELNELVEEKERRIREEWKRDPLVEKPTA